MKALKWTLIILGILALTAYFGFGYLKTQTKKASPEETVNFQDGDLKMSVFYCRPFKKEREIFGGLVPYGEVWRTGANEASTFTTSQEINFGGEFLKAGTYTLWTIPGEDEWSVILNSKMYDWGVDFSSKALREAEFDVVKVNVPTWPVPTGVIEQFTIRFGDNGFLILEWDETRVEVPIG